MQLFENENVDFSDVADTVLNAASAVSSIVSMLPDYALRHLGQLNLVPKASALSYHGLPHPWT